MKFSTLSAEWRKDLQIDRHEHDEVISKFERQQGVNEDEIRKNREERFNESIAFLYLVGKEHKAMSRSTLTNNAFEKLENDDKRLTILVYGRLHNRNLLSKHINKHINLYPLVRALINHFDTCESFDKAEDRIKRIVAAYIKADKLQAYVGAEELLTNILAASKHHKNDTVEFIEFLNVAHCMFLSEKIIDKLNQIIKGGGIEAAHQFTLKSYDLYMNIKSDKSIDRQDFNKAFIECMERTIKAAKHGIEPPKVDSSGKMSMMDGLIMMNFMIKTKPTPESSPEIERKENRKEENVFIEELNELEEGMANKKSVLTGSGSSSMYASRNNQTTTSISPPNNDHSSDEKPSIR